MTIDELKQKDIIVFECLSGSHAHGLNTAESDVDIKGVFILPEDEYFGLNYTAQVNDEKNDIVYYELKRFVELLAKSNPNILEMLYSPDDCVRIIHPVFEQLRQQNFLSKQCKESFGAYAMTQVRKASGLNKKILNPVDKIRKGVLDFCYIADDQGSVSIHEFLNKKSLKQEDCGLSKIPHMNEVYGVFHQQETLKGIVQKEDANDVSVSRIPLGMKSIAIMSFNQSAYSKYCKDYKAYWDWVDKRNDARYKSTVEHGKNYDAKNMMHTFRLLHMCEEIGREDKLHVRRPDKEYLFQIKNGAFEYEELKARAEQLIGSIDDVYQNSDLEEQPDINLLNTVLIQVRKAFYNRGKNLIF